MAKKIHPAPKKRRGPKKKKPKFNSPWKVNPYKEELISVTQADRVIEKFGGVPKLAEALANVGLKKNKSSIYRWTYPVGEKSGTGGSIPTSSLKLVIAAARNEGVLLSPEDLDPRVSFVKKRIWEIPSTKKKRKR